MVQECTDMVQKCADMIQECKKMIPVLTDRNQKFKCSDIRMSEQ